MEVVGSGELARTAEAFIENTNRFWGVLPVRRLLLPSFTFLLAPFLPSPAFSPLPPNGSLPFCVLFFSGPFWLVLISDFSSEGQCRQHKIKSKNTHTHTHPNCKLQTDLTM